MCREYVDERGSYVLREENTGVGLAPFSHTHNSTSGKIRYVWSALSLKSRFMVQPQNVNSFKKFFIESFGSFAKKYKL